jgi:hypothetical protein
LVARLAGDMIAAKKKGAERGQKARCPRALEMLLPFEDVFVVSDTVDCLNVALKFVGANWVAAIFALPSVKDANKLKTRCLSIRRADKKYGAVDSTTSLN